MEDYCWKGRCLDEGWWSAGCHTSANGVVTQILGCPWFRILEKIRRTILTLAVHVMLQLYLTKKKCIMLLDGKLESSPSLYLHWYCGWNVFKHIATNENVRFGFRKYFTNSLGACVHACTVERCSTQVILRFITENWANVQTEVNLRRKFHNRGFNNAYFPTCFIVEVSQK